MATEYFPEELQKFLARLNYEAKVRSEVEKKSLEVADKENQRNFNLESERLKYQANFYEKKLKNDFRMQLILAGGGLVFFSALVYFAYKGNTEVVKDVFFPLLFAVVSALGGYGYGLQKGHKQHHTE